MSPAISVVMSVFNGELYLHEAIQSILIQSFSDFEFIIVDDGSTDSSLSIIKSFHDERIVLLSQQNTGLAKALNNGIKLAKTSLIARMDADDVALPERLRIQYDFMKKHTNCVLCGGWAEIIDKDGNYVYTRRTLVDKSEIKDFFSKNMLNGLPKTPFFHSSVMFRLEDFILLGGYREYMRRAQDVVLFNMMNAKGDCYNIPKVLIKYRVVPGAITGRTIGSSLLGEILIKAINNETIDDKLSIALDTSLNKSNISEREYNYNMFLAKKYLWNNYQPQKARENLRMARGLMPHKIFPILLYMLTSIPENTLLRIYRFGKTREIILLLLLSILSNKY